MSGGSPATGPDDYPVSSIVGRHQAPALRSVVFASGGLAVLSLVLDMAGVEAAPVVAAIAVGLVVATPLLRVCWLIFRWAQEGDRPFMTVGLALLGVVGLGAILSLLGVGR